MKIRSALLVALLSSGATIGAVAVLDDDTLRHRIMAAADVLMNYDAYAGMEPGWVQDDDYPEPSDHYGAGSPAFPPLPDHGLNASSTAYAPPTAFEKPCAMPGVESQSTEGREFSSPLGAVTELHAVGVYEAVSAPQTYPATATRDTINVCVDRPGESVLLMLGAYDAINWRINTTEDTTVAGVVLQGYGAERSIASFHGRYASEPIPSYMVDKTTRMPYKESGPEFRKYAVTVPAAFGLPKLSSFQGDYTAPRSGFRIGEVEVDNPAFEKDPLASQISGADLLSDTHRAALGGEIPSSGWTFSDRGFHGMGAELTMPAPAALDISWPIDDVVEDTTNGFIFGADSHVYSRIYRADLETGEWVTLRSERIAEYKSLAWDKERNHLVLLKGDYGAGDLTIEAINPVTGDTIREAEVREPLPGLSDIYDKGNGPSPEFKILAIDQSYMLVSTQADRHASSFGRERPSRTYLINIETGKPHLIAYSEQPKAAPQTPSRAHRAGSHPTTHPERVRDEGPADEAAQALVHPSLDQVSTHSISAVAQQSLLDTIHGTKALFAARDSYRGLSTDLLRAAGHIPQDGSTEWGGSILASGQADTFTLKASGLPGPACAGLAADFSAEPSVIDAYCDEAGILTLMAR